MQNPKTHYELEAKTLTPGAKQVINLYNLPRGQRVTHIMLEITATITDVGALSALTTYPRELAKLIGQLYLESDVAKVRTTGQILWNLYKHMTGKSLSNTGISYAAGASAGEMTVFLIVPFADHRQLDAMDTAIPAELLEGRTLEIQCPDSFAVGTQESGVQTASNVTLRSTLFLGDGAGEVVPVVTRLDYEDWSQATAYLRPGSYSHLGIYDPADDLVTIAEYDRLEAGMDGIDVIDRIRVKQLVADYNDKHAFGASQDNELEQLPLDNLLFIPMITPPVNYKIPSVPFAQKTVRVDITGTATGARFYYRTLGERSPEVEYAAARIFGHREPERVQFNMKTVSKMELQAPPKRFRRLRRLLPLRLLG